MVYVYSADDCYLLDLFPTWFKFFRSHYAWFNWGDYVVSLKELTPEKELRFG